MKSFFSSLIAVAFLAAGVVGQQAITLNTPTTPTECVPIRLTWSGGQAPYVVQIFPFPQNTGPAITQFVNVQDTSLLWTPNITANSNLYMTISDVNGDTGETASFTIQSGPTTCLNGGSPSTSSSSDATSSSTTGSTTASTSSAPTTGSLTSTSGAPAGSSPATTPGSTSGSTTRSSSSSSASTSATGATGNTNGAMWNNVASSAVVGAIGAVAVALLG